MPDVSEVAFPIRDLLAEVTAAFADASAQLRKDFSEGGRWADAPFVYHMPSMSCEIKLTFSFTKEGVKGIFSKSKTKDEQELASTIKVDIVASPKSASSTN